MRKLTCIILCFIVFFLLVEIITTWDSYRFYQQGIDLHDKDEIMSIRYFGSSIKAKPLISYYSDKSRQELEEMLSRSGDIQITLMIQDELK